MSPKSGNRFWARKCRKQFDGAFPTIELRSEMLHIQQSDEMSPKSKRRKADLGVSRADEAKAAGGTLRQVEDASLDERAAIVDAHDE